MAEPSDPTSAQPSEPAGIERRVATRHPCSLMTSCRLLAAVRGGATPIRVRNISATGVSLVVGRNFNSGELLNIELKHTTRNVVRTLQVRVVYCIEHPGGESIVGGSFTQAMNPDDLKTFVG